MFRMCWREMGSKLFLFRTVEDACPYKWKKIIDAFCGFYPTNTLFTLLIVGTGVLDCPNQFPWAHKPTKDNPSSKTHKKTIGAAAGVRWFFTSEKKYSITDIDNASAHNVKELLLCEVLWRFGTFLRKKGSKNASPTHPLKNEERYDIL